VQNCPDVQIWRRVRLCPITRVDPVCRGHEARRVVGCLPSGLEREPCHFLHICEAMSFALFARSANPSLA